VEVDLTKALLVFAITLAGLAAAKPAEARVARCVVVVEGQSILDGPCEFRSEDRKGSFSLAAVNAQEWLMPYAGTISIWVTKPGMSEVFVVQERSSRWGKAKRSRTDRACWIGIEGSFKICAY
jgi:hypothetical protein